MKRLIPRLESSAGARAAPRHQPPSKHERPRITDYLYPTVRNYVNSLCRRCSVAVFIWPVCFNVPFQPAHADTHNRRALISQRRRRKPTSKHALAGHTPLHRAAKSFSKHKHGPAGGGALLRAPGRLFGFATLALVDFSVFFYVCFSALASGRDSGRGSAKLVCYN